MRTAVGCCAPKAPVLVEEFEDLEVEAAEAERPLQQLVGVVGAARQVGQRALDAGEHLVAGHAEHVRVVGVRAHALQHVQVQGAQADDVGADRVDPRGHADALGLLEQAVHVRGGLPGGGAVRLLRRQPAGPRRLLVPGPDPVADGRGLLQQGAEPGGVEVDVGQGREHRVQDELRGLVVGGVQGAGLLRVLRDALHRVDQQVLQVRGDRPLAAVAHRPCAPENGMGTIGLLALEAKHALSSLSRSPSGPEAREEAAAFP
jgi:hypothetical protein